MKRCAKEVGFRFGMSTETLGAPTPTLKRLNFKWSATSLYASLALAVCAPAPAQKFKVVYNLPDYTAPGWYARPVLVGNALYGIGRGISAYGSIFKVSSDGTGFSTIKNFPAPVFDGVSVTTNSDGDSPLGGLIASGGTLYGTTAAGGLYGFGTVYSLKTGGGNFTVLKHFSGPDGKAPYCELVLVSNVLYGTTPGGGDFGKGTVFQINPDGSGFNVLKSFAGSDGQLPLSGLTWSDGILYGTTSSGGAWTNGTVFSMLPDGTGFAKLHDFDGVQGSAPRYSLAVSGSWIYGTTEGAASPSQSLVYKLSTDGSQYQVLKTFSPLAPYSGTNADGYYSQSGLVATGGVLFGSTREGGYYGSGVLFALRTDGSGYTVLKHFSTLTNSVSGEAANGEGAEPGPLSVFGAVLYGTTKAGGPIGVGSLYALNFAPTIQVPNSTPNTVPFSFNVIGFSNQVVCVQACADLQAPSWLPVATNTIGGGPLQFSDFDATNYPNRFYRLQAW